MKNEKVQLCYFSFFIDLVDLEGVEPSSRQGIAVLSTCLALFEL